MYDIDKMRFWCQKIIPLVYEDSLSYYETLCKVIKKLNEVIESVDNIPEYIAELISTEHLQDIMKTLLVNLESQIASANEGLSETATADRPVGTLVWLNGYLYRATKYIDAGDRYVAGGNVEKITIEGCIKDLQLAITDNYEDGERVASADREVGELVWFKNELLLIKQHIDEGNAYTDANSEVVDFSSLFLTIENAISNEVTARGEADTALGLRITDEVTARGEADTALGQRITDEVTARGEADTALGQRIDAVEDDIESLEQSITNINTWVTPSMYGAVGDGVTDDTEALDDAINSGKVVYLDRKTYKVTSLITLPSNLIMFGGKIVFQNPIVTMKADGESNIRFDDVEITIAYLEGTDAKNRIDWFPLQFDNCERVILNNCVFHCNDCRSVGFRFCYGCVVNKCTFDDIEGTSLTIVASNFMRVSYCDFDGTNQYDNSWHTSDVYGKLDSCDDILFVGCHYYKYRGCAVQFTSTPGTWNITNARVKNCVIENWNDCGIKVDGVMAEIVFEGNVFDNNNYYNDANSAYPFSLGGQSGIANNVVIKNNVFRSINKGYIVTENLDATVHRLVLDGNIISGSNGRLFKMEAGKIREMVFENNIIEGLQFYVFMPSSGYIAKSYLVFKNNKIRTSLDDFYVILGASYIVFSDNYIGTDIRPNIHMYAGVARVENNQVTKESDYAGATYLLRGPSEILGTLIINNNRVGSLACAQESDVTAGEIVKYQLAT